MPVPALRVRAANDRPVAGDGDHVLYWMTSARRTTHSFGLQRAVERALELGRPLLVLEALRCGYRWASDRLHRFVLEGMADQAAAFAAAGVTYLPYLEPTPGAGKGLLEALARRACLVVTDEFPCFFLPRMLAAAAARLPVRLEVVDGNGLLPLAAAPKDFARAHDLRRFLQRTLRAHLQAFPDPAPLALLPRRPAAAAPADVLRRWPMLAPPELEALRRGAGLDLSRLPIDHAVGPAAARGGARAAADALAAFVARRLAGYAEDRNDPSAEATSGLSPYLHFGHVAAHEVVRAVLEREGWNPDKLGARTDGAREGWWGVSPSAEGFLDQVVTWRELGFLTCARRPDDHDRYASLPAWARATLERHAGDPRTPTYGARALEAAATHDPLWNAAQRQLVREGRMHNYLRMLWGKKVLEWSPTPAAALEVLIHLNNAYALDGRDPNSYSGIFWCFGRYDRAWGPERPVFGTVRYMSSENTARKLDVKGYLARYGPARPVQAGLFSS